LDTFPVLFNVIYDNSLNKLHSPETVRSERQLTLYKIFNYVPHSYMNIRHMNKHRRSKIQATHTKHLRPERRENNK
jgi:hypothetical protein